MTARDERRRTAQEPGHDDARDTAKSAAPRPYDEDVSAFVERFAADMTEAGMPRMASRVFACLLAEDAGALSSAELAERLRISPAAVSGAVRYLSRVHMVSRERAPGSRRELYRLHTEVWHEAMTSRETVLSRWLTTFGVGVETLGRDTPAGARVAETAEFFDFMRHELATMLDRWHAHRATLDRRD